MRNLSVLIMIVSLVISISCGKSGDSGPDRIEGTPTKIQSKKPHGESDARTKSGRKPGSKRQGEDIDVDKLDIPDRIKEAIKSGSIPKDKIPQILAQAKKQGGPGDTGDAFPVSVAPVERKNLNSYIVLNGTVEPERKIEIYSRLSAYVKRIVKEEGSYVKQNDILAFLDDTEIKISYKQVEIALDQAKLSLEEAENNYARSQQLIKRDLISEQEFQASEAQKNQRKLDYQNRLEAFKTLKIQLSWTKIQALSEGYITERLIEVGDRVNANTQVYTIEDFKPLLIRVFVPTSDSIKLAIGMPAEVSNEALRGFVLRGKVKLINPRVDVETGTVKVTIEVLDESLQLKPGMFVEARIAIGKKENVLVIPRKAILYKQNKTYVFVLDRNRVTQREIDLGLIEEDDVEMTGGLGEGEVIVVVGVEGLKDGQVVDIIQ
ncbi:efflux RND transporter periplasmic adaptor subunit [Acidobacteriota bacterium]